MSLLPSIDSKRYIILLLRRNVDKYLIIILMFVMAGMIISVTEQPFRPGLFYSMLAGAIIIIIYAAMKERKLKQEKRRERRRSKK